MVQSEVSHICRAGQWGSVLTDYRVSGCPVLIYKHDQAFLGMLLILSLTYIVLFTGGIIIRQGFEQNSTIEHR